MAKRGKRKRGAYRVEAKCGKGEKPNSHGGEQNAKGTLETSNETGHGRHRGSPL